MRAAAVALAVALVLLGGAVDGSCAASLRLAVFGDSLTAGWGLPLTEAFPTKLQQALRDKGLEVDVANFGVSGDTTAGGLARIDDLIKARPDAVILELGANDALRGLDPGLARKNLEAMLSRLEKAGIPALLCGMRAPANMGRDYVAAFNAIYPDLAAKYKIPLFPFFLAGVAGNPELNQPDGLHPNADGVAVIVEGIEPAVAAFLNGLTAPKPAAPAAS